MVWHARADHLHASDQVVLDAKRVCHVNARCAAGETAHVGHLAGVQFDLSYCAIHVEDTVAPDNAALFVHQREPPMMDVVDDAQISALELLLAAGAHVVKAARCCGGRTRGVRGVRAILVGDRDELLTRRALRWRNWLEPERFGCFRLSIAAILFGPPPPARKYDVSISVIRPNWTRSRTVINSKPDFSRIVPIHPASPPIPRRRLKPGRQQCGRLAWDA